MVLLLFKVQREVNGRPSRLRALNGALLNVWFFVFQHLEHCQLLGRLWELFQIIPGQLNSVLSKRRWLAQREQPTPVLSNFGVIILPKDPWKCVLLLLRRGNISKKESSGDSHFFRILND